MRETLICAGADVNISDCRGNTVLHKVLENPDCDVVKCLKIILAAGANVSMVNKRGDDILKNATYQRYNPVVRTLLFVAGEKALRRNNKKEFCVSHLCRDVIRKHLLQMNNRNFVCQCSETLHSTASAETATVQCFIRRCLTLNLINSFTLCHAGNECILLLYLEH